MNKPKSFKSETQLFYVSFLQLEPSGNPKELFAVHLTSALTSSEGGTNLRDGYTTAPIEPYGVVGFAQRSRQIIVPEGQGEVKQIMHLNYE